MTVVNGPIGGQPKKAGRRIVEGVRCHRLCHSRKGQALVETALLLPILMFLVMGSADLGRVFYYSIETTNAAREGARQGTYYDPRSRSNVYDSYGSVFNAVHAEAPDLSLSIPAATRCLTGSPSSWTGYYPTNPNTGYVYICFDDNNTQATPALNTINVIILYNFQPVTPIAQVIGSSYVQVVSNITMQVQQQP